MTALVYGLIAVTVATVAGIVTLAVLGKPAVPELSNALTAEVLALFGGQVFFGHTAAVQSGQATQAQTTNALASALSATVSAVTGTTTSTAAPGAAAASPTMPTGSATAPTPATPTPATSSTAPTGGP